MSNQINVDVYGVSAELASPLQDFLEFTQQNYSFFLKEKIRSPHLIIDFSKEAGALAQTKKESMDFIGNGIYLGKNALYWENEFGFKILVSLFSKNCWSISSFHYDLLKNLNRENRYKNFQRSMRWILHLPIFSLLQLYKKKILIHASAVAREDGALIFCGMNKIGKSLLAGYLTRNDEYRFMSDNFLFYDEKKVYGFPERIRLTPESVKKLHIKDIEEHKIYGKLQFNFSLDEVCLKAKPKACFLMTKSTNLSISKLNPKQAVHTILGIQNLLGEFPEHSYLTFLPYFGIYINKNRESIKSILSQTKWYLLRHPFDWDLKKLSEMISRCI